MCAVVKNSCMSSNYALMRFVGSIDILRRSDAAQVLREGLSQRCRRNHQFEVSYLLLGNLDLIPDGACMYQTPREV